MDDSRGHPPLGARDEGNRRPAESCRDDAGMEEHVLAWARDPRDPGKPPIAFVGPFEHVADHGGADARGGPGGAVSGTAREGVEPVVEAAVLDVEEGDEDVLDLRGPGVPPGLRPRELRRGDQVVEHAVRLAGVGLVAEHGGAERVRGVEEEGLRGEHVAEARAPASEAEVASGGGGGGGEEEPGEGARVGGAAQRRRGGGTAERA